MDKNYFREIPKVDYILEDEKIKKLINIYSRKFVVDTIAKKTDELRCFISEEIKKDNIEAIELKIKNIIEDTVKEIELSFVPNLKKVINATGTILHTNLGRALISKDIARKALDIVSGYSNLEYNLKAGKRGERYSSFSDLLCNLTGAEAAMAVNNNAAAVMLILSTLAKDGEVIVSRGELVEIGGKFRVPDVCAASGAKLVEVGTTNKTHLSDYEEVINQDTKAVLKVHTSNYSIIGFTQNVKIDELRPICKDIPLIEDLGSGVLVDLAKYGLKHEPTVQESIKAGADIVCFSGDKLLGGPQAGIIVGKKKYIDMIKKNQLTRALRIDKFTVTALELVLMQYLNKEKLEENIPVLRMIKEDYSSVLERAKILKDKLEVLSDKIEVKFRDCESQIGGGSLPGEFIKSVGLTIKANKISTAKLEEKLRFTEIPIIGRTIDDMLLFDIRTIDSEDFDAIVNALGGIL